MLARVIMMKLCPVTIRQHQPKQGSDPSKMLNQPTNGQHHKLMWKNLPGPLSLCIFQTHLRNQLSPLMQQFIECSLSKRHLIADRMHAFKHPFLTDFIQLS